MNKKLLSLLLLFSVLLLGGCTLAKEEMVNKQPDRLIGVYLTTEMPDPSDENWMDYGSSDISTEFGKIQLPNRILPAQFDREGRAFSFPSLKGYALFSPTVQDGEDIYTTSVSDLADGTYHTTVTDFGDSLEMDGTLYVGNLTEDTLWKANLVYQNADGLVYLDGSGNSYQGGVSGFSGAVEQTVTTAVDGKEGSVFTRVKFSIRSVDALEKIVIHQYNQAGERIHTLELPAAARDQKVSWTEGAAWAVVEEHFSDHVKRTAYDVPKEETEDIYHRVIVLNQDQVGEDYNIHFTK